MIEGVLRHCTAMQVDRTYVDTHGQSEVAFAFCHLLGFQLMPRLKNLHAQKLSLATPGTADNYPPGHWRKRDASERKRSLRRRTRASGHVGKRCIPKPVCQVS